MREHCSVCYMGKEERRDENKLKEKLKEKTQITFRTGVRRVHHRLHVLYRREDCSRREEKVVWIVDSKHRSIGVLFWCPN